MANGPIKVAVYIDGFNLFHKIKKQFGKKYYWLDYHKLASQFLQHNEKLIKIYYFTAYYNWDTQGVKRHKTYVSALNSIGVQTIFGKYQFVTKVFTRQKNNIEKFIYKNIISKLPKSWQFKFIPDRIEYKNFEEKRTDVNVAIHILQDGLLDVYDKAFVISGDSDISPAIRSVKKKNPNKDFILLLPPGAKAHTMTTVCDQVITITENDLKNSLLPPCINGIQKPKQRK